MFIVQFSSCEVNIAPDEQQQHTFMQQQSAACVGVSVTSPAALNHGRPYPWLNSRSFGGRHTQETSCRATQATVGLVYERSSNLN